VLMALWPHVEETGLGMMLGGRCPVWVSGQVRFPTLGAWLWTQVERRPTRRDKVLPVAPALAVEFITPGEMARMRRDYFASGTRLFWEVEEDAEIVSAYTGPEEYRRFGERDTLDVGPVLPGVRIPVSALANHRFKQSLIDPDEISPTCTLEPPR